MPNEALPRRRMGMQPLRSHQPSWTYESILEALVALKNYLGRWPIDKDLQKKQPLERQCGRSFPSNSTVRQQFGSWSWAITQARVFEMGRENEQN